MKCIIMSLKDFQKHLNLSQIFQKQNFHTFVPKTQTMKHILHQNQRAHNLGWPKQIHTQLCTKFSKE